MSDLKSLRTAALSVVVDRYLLDVRMKNYSWRSLESYTSIFRHFIGWCDERSIESAISLNDEAVSAYRRHLFHRISPRSGEPLKFSTQSAYLYALRSFCRWMLRHGIIDADPMLHIEIPSGRTRQLADVLTGDEVTSVLAAPDVNTHYGIRDRGILETFYSTAMRASELSNLCCGDIDAARGTVHIRQGKGGKDRLVPIGKQALHWIDKYRAEVRETLVKPHSGQKLFLSRWGRNLRRDSLAWLVRNYFEQAGVEKRGACHVFRHTAATLMMENGADLRALQAYLGHEKLNTTQIYTHMTLGRLKDVHARTHPTGDKHQPKQDDDKMS